MKYISPLLLLKYCQQPESLTSVPLNITRRQLQMKFDFDRLECIEIDGVTYIKQDVQAILQTISYERDIRNHQWIHKIPALLGFLTGKNTGATSLGAPDELLKSRDFDAFKRFTSPFLLPAVADFYAQIITTRNYGLAVLVNEMGVLIDSQNSDRYLTNIRSHLSSLLTKSDSELTEIRNSNSYFEQYIQTIPTAIKSEKESLASRLRMSGVQGDEKPIEQKQAEPKKIPRPNTYSQQDAVKQQPKSGGQPKQTARPKVDINQKPKTYLPVESVVKSAASKVMVRVLISFAIMTVVFGVGIALLVNTAVDDATEIGDALWDETEDMLDLNQQEFEDQVAEISEYIDKKKSDVDDAISEMADYYRETDSTASAPFSTEFSSFSYSGGESCKFVNSTDYAIILLVNTEVLNYSVFMGSHSETQGYIQLNPNDELLFYAGKKYHDTPDLTAFGPKGFRYVDDVTSELWSTRYVVGDSGGPSEETDPAENTASYSIELKQDGDKITPHFMYNRPIRPKAGW